MQELEKFVQEKPAGCLYHYTGPAGALGIVQSRCLWATDYRHLNDRQEYRLGQTRLREEMARAKLKESEKRAFDRLLNEARSNWYVLSFSENGDQLSQWRAYCAGSQGYSLGFSQNNELFTSAKNESFSLVRCVYSPSEQTALCKYLIDSFMDGLVKKGWVPAEGLGSRIKAFFKRYQWNLALTLVLSAVKHSGFVEENEWRLVSQYPDEALSKVSFRVGRFGVTPYFELPLQVQVKSTRLSPNRKPLSFDEVVIGPTHNKTASRTALEVLFAKQDVVAGQIALSQTPLRL